jgi:hypothetical protein
MITPCAESAISRLWPLLCHLLGTEHYSLGGERLLAAAAPSLPATAGRCL